MCVYKFFGITANNVIFSHWMHMSIGLISITPPVEFDINDLIQPCIDTLAQIYSDTSEKIKCPH